MKNYHSISCYDKNLCLKPSGLMWLILIFLSRAYIVMALSVVNRQDKTALIDMVYPDRFAISVGALAAVPAVLLLYAWTRRAPGASSFVRAIWSRGRALLTASALLNAVAIFVPYWLATEDAIPVRDWVQGAMALLVVGIVYQSTYINDCFSDFPSAEAPAET